MPITVIHQKIMLITLQVTSSFRKVKNQMLILKPKAMGYFTDIFSSRHCACSFCIQPCTRIGRKVLLPWRYLQKCAPNSNNSVHHTKQLSVTLSVPLNLTFLSATVNFEERHKRGHCKCIFRQHISKNSYTNVASQFLFSSKTCPLYCGQWQKSLTVQYLCSESPVK